MVAGVPGAGRGGGYREADAGEATELASLAGARTVLLTTFRRDVTPVATPVHIAGKDGRVFIRTFDPSGKLKRIRRNPEVLIAPCRSWGTVTGPTLRARARILSGDQSRLAAGLLAAKYPLLHGLLIPVLHRVRGYRTTHLELVPL